MMSVLPQHQSSYLFEFVLPILQVEMLADDWILPSEAEYFLPLNRDVE